jgi:hypothetical protein
MADRILTDEETRNLIMALGRGQTEFTEADIEKVLDWGTEVKALHSMFTLVLQGLVRLSIDSDRELCFGLTDKGLEIGEALAARRQ